MIYRALRSLEIDASINQVANWIDKYCEKDSSDLGFWQAGAEVFSTEKIANAAHVRKDLEDALYAVRRSMKAAEDEAGCKVR